MIDEDSDWISLDAAVTHVEAWQLCHREKALDLVRQAADNFKLKSRTTANSSPRWVVSDIAGVQKFHSDGGTRIEVYREDVLKLWPEHQKGATRPAPPTSQSNTTQRREGQITAGIRLALNNLWPDRIFVGVRPKERDNKILEWLKYNGKSIPTDISRAVQRVLKAERDAHKSATPA